MFVTATASTISAHVLGGYQSDAGMGIGTPLEQRFIAWGARNLRWVRQ